MYYSFSMEALTWPPSSHTTPAAVHTSRAIPATQPREFSDVLMAEQVSSSVFLERAIDCELKVSGISVEHSDLSALLCM